MKNRRVIIVIFMALTLSPSLVSHALEAKQAAGPIGGTVFSLESEPSGDMLGGTEDGLYRYSMEIGQWKLVGLNGRGVAGLFSSTSGTYFASASETSGPHGSGNLVSFDGAETWEHAPGFEYPDYPIAIDEGPEGVFWAGTWRGGLYKWDHVERRWMRHFPAIEVKSIEDLRIDSDSNMLLAVQTYLGTSAVLRSTDGGNSWGVPLITDTQLSHIAVGGDGVVLVGSNHSWDQTMGQVYSSEDHGQTWMDATCPEVGE